MLSRSVRRRVRNWFAGVVGPRLIRLWNLTLRVRLIADVRLHGRVPLPVENGIYVLWHQDMLTPAGVFRDSGFRCMISQHADGEMIARVVSGLGMKPLRGSTTRGGSKVLREFLAEGAGDRELNVIITPDGPRGPRHSFQAGAIYLASRSGLPICPVAVSLRKSWSLPTWDGFQVPRPFSRALIRAGSAVRVPPDLDRDGIEEYRQRLERLLVGLNEETDRSFDELFAQAVPCRKVAPAETPAAGRERRGSS